MNKELSKILSDKLRVFVTDTTKRCADKVKFCRYSGTTIGKDAEIGCFVGLFFSPEDRVKLDDYFCGKSSSVSDIVWGYRDLEDKFPVVVPSIIMENSSVFREFQSIHDTDFFWTTNGLTIEGKLKLTSTIRFNNLDISDFEFALNND